MKSLLWMKQIQGSVRVKIEAYVHAWSEFLFVSPLLIFNLFPQINHIDCFSLYMACKMWKITALTWEISSWRLVEKFHISAFPMYYSLYNWIREHGITKPKKKNTCFESRKKDTQAQKDINGMEWHKMDYLIFSAMRMRKRHLFCASSHHSVPYEKQQELNKGSEPYESLLERVRNC